MGIENASFIEGLNPDAPQGTESISEGDNHIRLIKYALTKTFPQLNSEVPWTPADFQRVLAYVDTAPDPTVGNGVFASLKYNGQEDQIMYSSNIAGVTQKTPGQTRVDFVVPTSGFDNHYAIQLTPIASNNRAVIVMVNDQRSSYMEFATKEEVQPGVWGVPTVPIGFYLTMVDMIQQNQG